MIKTIGIVGAGQMGGGIAHVCGLAGLKVLVHDINAAQIESGLATIAGNMARQVASERISEAEKQAALGNIQAAENLELLGAADLVIEAATENELVKQEIYTKLCPVLAPCRR